ncbi:MAG: SAVED domain-containing protein [Pseudomonadota bacterium]
MMQPPKFFLSYSRKDVEDLAIIARILMIHGIKTWQDINSLGSGLTEAEIRKAIQENCTGLVFYSTDDSLKAPMIRNVELKVAEEKFLQDKNFHIVPIFKSGIEASNIALNGCLKTKISDFNGTIVRDNDLMAAAQRAASLVLKNLSFPTKDFLPVGVVSYQKNSDDVALNLDFTPYFQEGLPLEKTWNREFVPAIASLKESLLSKRITNLRLFSRAHLSFGLMFGYIFRDRTGFVIEVEQINKPNREIWSTQAKEESTMLTIECTPVTNFGVKDIVVNLNIISDDNNSFSNYVQKSGLRYRALIEAKPSSYPFLISNGQAVVIARELTNKIKEAHGTYNTNVVHLFAAVPFGLAVIIGHQLNACGRIQCYEFDKAKREYSPSVTLEN